ncbi:MAG TPA: hypothetical protein VKV17_00995 [Bryobacteraceae bacterium]|nr:hypothetical protein [Bryobacteraceae bacterium]
MIAYREQRRRVRASEFLRQAEAARGFERQMLLGQFEAGVADALCPDCDRDLGDHVEPPEEIEISVPEGFAYYALDPELYERAAARFVKAERPQRVAVIGIRAIGTTLSAIVARRLRESGCAVARWTVRPRGHPWNRELRIDQALAQAWRAWPGLFAVVDEGPGLSGSSFAAVSACLESLGIAPERVVLFPSWTPDGSAFISAPARARWLLHRKYCIPFEDLGLFGGACDLGAGKWRALRGLDLPVQPQHERRKYLSRGREGALPTLYKFAGYANFGRAALARAEALRGWIPGCGELDRGFISMPWVSGRPPKVNAQFLDHAARYLAHVSHEFPAHEPVRFEPLAELIAVNSPRAPDAARWRGAVEDGHAVHLDARMFPHEWIETPAGYLKADALDHHDDHFFPGPQDPAWDVAGTIVEFALDAAAENHFVEVYRRASADRAIRARLPFYRLAYLAFRVGYWNLAGERFARERARSEALLEAVLS